MKNQIENPKGLHARYKITKLKVVKNPKFGQTIDRTTTYGKRKVDYPEFITQETAIDKGSEYFILRLDLGDSDIEHIKACRIGIHAYAEAIKHHLPELASDLIKRYPLI